MQDWNDAPCIILGIYAEDFLNSLSPKEQVELWRVLCNLLLDPTVDLETRFEADYYPFTGQGYRECRYGGYFILYRALSDGSLEVPLIQRLVDPW